MLLCVYIYIYIYIIDTDIGAPEQVRPPEQGGRRQGSGDAPDAEPDGDRVRDHEVPGV